MDFLVATLALFVATGGAPLVEFGAIRLSPDEAAALDARKAVVRVERDRSARGAAAEILGIIDVKASPQTLWEVMLDCARAPAIIPHMKSCKVIEQASNGAHDIREHVVSYTFLFPNVRSVFRSDYRLFEEIRFQRIEGDLRIMEGVWTLAPVNNGDATRVTYRARVATGTPAPRALIRRSVRADMPDILTSLREMAERDGAPDR